MLQRFYEPVALGFMVLGRPMVVKIIENFHTAIELVDEAA